MHKRITPEEAEALWQLGVEITYSTDYMDRCTVVKTEKSRQGPIWVEWAGQVHDENPLLEVEVE